MMATETLELHLLNRIRKEQELPLQTGGNCLPGIFVSKRFHQHLPLQRADDNVFFTASILFLLQLYRPQLSEQGKQLADSILEAGKLNYPHYKNRHGLNTYNFYRTNPSVHFPNGLIMHKLRHFQLPDDADDTALIYLTKPATLAEVQWLKNKLPEHANLHKLQVKTTLPDAAPLKAYSTWFGKEMPIEFDACVMCNLLFLIYEYKLPLNEHDQACIAFLKMVISRDAYFKNPFEVSPAYPSASIIIYHIVRLITRFDIPELKPLLPKLKSDLERVWQQSSHFMERVILDTSRMRLGGPAQLEIREQDMELKDVQKFAWFTAAFLAPFGNPVLHYLAKYPLFQMKFACPAMSYALLLEHEVNRRSFEEEGKE